MNLFILSNHSIKINLRNFYIDIILTTSGDQFPKTFLKIIYSADFWFSIKSSIWNRFSSRNTISIILLIYISILTFLLHNISLFFLMRLISTTRLLWRNSNIINFMFFFLFLAILIKKFRNNQNISKSFCIRNRINNFLFFSILNRNISIVSNLKEQISSISKTHLGNIFIL